MVRVIIIGGGIGGLATYHSLLKHLSPSDTVDVYEAYSPSACKSSVLGGGIVLGPNGQRAIASISPSAIPYIRDRAFEFTIMTVRNDLGKTLAHLPFGSRERYGYSPMTVSRVAVYESLMLADEMDSNIHWSMRAVRVWETDEAAHVEFENGSIESCDLLIGADGAKSRTREALFGDDYAAQYEGLTGFSGLIPLSSLSTVFQDQLKKQGSATMTIGPDGFFGLSLCNPVFSPDPYVNWFTSIEFPTPLPRKTPRSELKPKLLEHFSHWKSPYDTLDDKFFAEVISVSCTQQQSNGCLTLPRWYTPTLPHLTSLHGLTFSGSANGARGRGRIIVSGDAAHCMPPDGAQGVSLAVEDALTIALVLKYHLKTSDNESEAVSKAAQSYEDIRLVRVNKILADAKERQNRKKRVSGIKHIIREWVIWAFSFLPEWYVHDEILGYNVEKHVASHLGVALDRL